MTFKHDINLCCNDTVTDQMKYIVRDSKLKFKTTNIQRDLGIVHTDTDF